MRRVLALSLVTLLVLALREARSAEVTTGMQVGYGRRVAESESRSEGLVALGLRGNLLFGRDSWDDFGIGPELGLSLPDPFHEAQGDAAVALLLPVSEGWPIVVSVGSWLGSGEGRVGAIGRLLLAARAFNYTSAYVTTVGVFVEARVGLVGARDTDVVAGVHVDGYALLYPFVILYESIRAGPP